MNSTDPDQFFQSDQDLLARKRREERRNFDRGNGKELTGKVLSILLHQGYAYLATAGYVILKIDLKTRKIVATWKEHKGPVTSLALTQDGNLVSGSWDKTAILWNLESQKPTKVFDAHRDFVKAVATHGDFLFTGSSDTHIRKWDLKTAKSLLVMESHKRGIEDLQVHDGFLFSSSSDGTIKKWSLDGDLITTFQEHLTTVYCLHFHENFMFSGSADKTVKKWDLETGKVDSTFEHNEWIKAILVISSNLITAGKEEDIRVWDLSTEKQRLTIRGHFDEVSCLAPLGGTKFLSAGLDYSLREWDLSDDPKKLEGLEEQEKEKKSNVVLTEDEEAELKELLDD